MGLLFLQCGVHMLAFDQTLDQYTCGRSSTDNYVHMMTHAKKYKTCVKRKVNVRKVHRRTGLESGFRLLILQRTLP
jgi:hypothetical protein